MKKLPVFVFPLSLDFYLGSRLTHKQLLTLYNPYDFSVQYRVLCTSPSQYTVIDPQGGIPPQNSVDIVVRFNSSKQASNISDDRFRIIMTDKISQQVVGRRDVPARFIAGEPESSTQESTADNFQPIVNKNMGQQAVQDQMISCGHIAHRNQQPINYVALSVGVVCIATLMLPTRPESSTASPLPDYLHLSLHFKLVVSFVLGLVSMVVLRQ